MKKVKINFNDIQNESIMMQIYAFKMLLQKNYIKTTGRYDKTSLSQVLFDYSANPYDYKYHNIGVFKENKYRFMNLKLNRDKEVVRDTLKKAKINLDTHKFIKMPKEDYDNLCNLSLLCELKRIKMRKINKEVDRNFVSINKYSFSSSNNDAYVASLKLVMNELGNVAIVADIVFEKAKDSLIKEYFSLKNFDSITEMITKTVEWINENTTECSELSRRLSIFDRQAQGN